MSVQHFMDRRILLRCLLVFAACQEAGGSRSCAKGFLRSDPVLVAERDLEPTLFGECVKDQHDERWLILFHSGMCDTCRAFQATWKGLVSQLRLEEATLGLRFGRIDVDQVEGSELATSENTIQEGLPSVVLYMGSGTPGNMLWYSVGEEADFPTVQSLQLQVITGIRSMSKSHGTSERPLNASTDLDSSSVAEKSFPALGASLILLLAILVLAWVTIPRKRRFWSTAIGHKVVA